MDRRICSFFYLLDTAKMSCFHFVVDSKWISFILFLLAAMIHLGFFFYESIILQQKNGHKHLGIDPQTHAQVKVWAFNQGFYNLFLAIGMLIGLFFVLQKQVMLAGVMAGFSGACMVFAGIVLAISVPRLRKFALVQALPPAFGFIFLYFHISMYGQ